MLKTTDKPQDIMDEKNVDVSEPIQSPEKQRLGSRVQELFRGSYEAKDQMDLMERWAKYDDYKHNKQNPIQTPEHPGSVTNIIHPIIEGQISDLTDKPFSTVAEGREPGDDMFSDDVQEMMDFILERNQFNVKLDISEHDRLELGTTVIKTYFDSKALDGKGLPSFEIVSPANFFPDPKWTATHLLQECEFVIHAVPRALSWIRAKFPKLGQYVVRETTCPYDPDLDTPNFKTDEVSPSTSQKALLIECYMRDTNGDIYCVHVANNIVLEDSRELLGKGEKLQRRNQFPFVAIPCYTQRGTGWGQGDVELLIPTQDLINEMDDQIRMTARLMGNPQIVVGRGAGKGFDNRKWTNKPGLRVPMQDSNAWKVVPGVPVSPDVVNRREKGFEEANIISGRPDVSRGEAPGQITAASAIMALQQAGQKQVIHKARMWKQGWALVLMLLYDELMDNWDESMWVRISGDKPDYKFIDPTTLRNVPVMVPNLNPMEGEDTIKQLSDVQPVMNGEEPVVDELGQPLQQMAPMTRDAEFDLTMNIGDGLPSDKTFMYQTMMDLSGKMVEGRPVVSWQELRNFLRDDIGFRLGNDNMIPPPPMPGMPTAMPGAPQLQGLPGGVPNVG
jgi:hypothetical protein